MATLFFDGCEHASSPTEKGWTISGAVSYSTTQKRTGSRSLYLNGSSYANLHAQRAFGSNLATSRLLFGFYTATTAAFGLCGWVDGSTIQVSLRYNADGTITALRGNWSTGTVLGTSSATITGSSFGNHIEAAATIDGTSGSVQVWLNGVSILSLTGVNTKASANAYATGGFLGWQGAAAGASGAVAYYDDIILSSDTAQIGAATVVTLMPSGAGTTTQWTPSTGANYAAVDETTANSDTDYVSSSTSGQIDTYAMGDLAGTTSGTILAVAVNVVARDDAGGSPQLQPTIRSGGANYSGTAKATSSTYANLQEIWETDPATTATWTISGVNALEAGVKKV